MGHDLSFLAKRLVGLVENDRLAQALTGVALVVETSFDQDEPKLSTIRLGEVRLRLEKAANLFCGMRQDHKWSVDRCLQELPNALRSDLDGVPWKPDAGHALWKPGDGLPLAASRFVGRA